MGHQVCPPVPVSALSGLLSSILNNGMAIYEMGSGATAIEKIVISTIAKSIGYDENSDGFLTSGGTLANLTALLAARQLMSEKNIWENGVKEKLAVMVSEEAHYCIDKAVQIMGLGLEGVIKIPVNDKFEMDTSLLETHYQKAKKEGLKVMAVVGSAPSTSTGVYDRLTQISAFCKKYGLWFHVDGAHGGAAVFSDKYKFLVKGILEADSIVIDGHKMMMTPAITTALLFKKGNDSYAAFNQKAQYLWGKSADAEWYNVAKRSLECTKSMMSIRFYSIIKTHGIEIFNQYITRQYDLARTFADLIIEHNKFELALEPSSNIVCFRYYLEDMKLNELNELNHNIRTRLLEKGEFYIVETNVKEKTYLRTSLMNPFTQLSHLEELLNRICQVTEEIISV